MLDSMIGTVSIFDSTGGSKPLNSFSIPISETPSESSSIDIEGETEELGK
jgi:hypothetical protein